jgi:hypothetical protein
MHPAIHAGSFQTQPLGEANDYRHRRLVLVPAGMKAHPEKESCKLLLLLALFPLFARRGAQMLQNVAVLARDSMLCEIKRPVLRDCWFHHRSFPFLLLNYCPMRVTLSATLSPPILW